MIEKRAFQLFVIAAGLWAVSSCSYDPAYDGALCDAEGECPRGFSCVNEGNQSRCRSEAIHDGEPVVTDDGGDQGQDDGGLDGYDKDSDGGPDCDDPDMDGDGHLAIACGGDDCDDSNNRVYLEAPELCDGVDNDCDGKTDAEDGDLRVTACDQQDGVCRGAARDESLCRNGAWLACRPEDFSAHDAGYEAEETLCDGLDNDCDGLTDESLSGPACAKTLGVCAGVTRPCLGEHGFKEICDPVDYGQDYEATETRCDGLDNDCDGVTDGMSRDCSVAHFGPCAQGTETCAGGSFGGCPAPSDEVCDPAGIDEDCDGSVDEGCTGCTSGSTRNCPLQAGVCLGAQSTCIDDEWSACDYGPQHEQPPETSCDGLDNDCDGTTDGMTRPCGQTHVGWCSIGSETCIGADSWDGCPPPQPEVCDNFDNDCDDQIDAADPDLVTTPCEMTTGVCTGEHFHDLNKCTGGVWNPCDATEYGPDFSGESCGDGLDNDCDGLTDCGPPACEGAMRDCQNDCLAGKQICQAGVWAECLPAVGPENISDGNCLDGLDNDCDGQSDCFTAECDGYEEECANQCHSGHMSCQGGAFVACDAAAVVDERERNDNCGDSVDNDCDGKTDSDDDQCCATAGMTGALLLLWALPFVARRRRRKTASGGSGTNK